jgi:hypothetical protein
MVREGRVVGQGVRTGSALESRQPFNSGLEKLGCSTIIC